MPRIFASERKDVLSARRGSEDLASRFPALTLEADKVARTVAQGIHGRRKVGSGYAFWQFRPYQAGDAVRDIDWRRSAKSDKFFVRETEWDAAATIWLWADLSPSMDYRSKAASVTKLERTIVLTLALAMLLARSGEKVGLLGTGARPLGGPAASDRMTELLLDQYDRTAKEAEETDTPYAGSVPPRDAIPAHARLVWIGDFLAPDGTVENAMEYYAANQVRGHMVQILDPSEEDFPFKGRVEFQGMEHDGQRIVGKAESLREGYLDALSALRDNLSLTARRLAWTFSWHRTDHSPHLALRALYEVMAGDVA
ncbi:MAG TPA: DUF58 domain-containing protein [Alphaproteobacteria bacterium]|nr:DUF58 domain-containing protein [Alphaproteobacteria bacterium]